MKVPGSDLNSVPGVPPGIAFRIIEEEAVLVNPENRMIYVLNHTGASAWQKIDGRKTVQEIARLIGAEYQVAQSVAENDLQELFGNLARRGLLSWKK